MHGFDIGQTVIIDTIYNPYYYPSTDSFVSFIKELHNEFKIEQSATFQSAINKAAVNWPLAMNYWWKQTIQARVENVVGFSVLSELNYGLLFGKPTKLQFNMSDATG